MSTLTDSERRWAEGYYAPLVGATITATNSYVDTSLGYETVWTQFTAVTPSGDTFTLELSADPEGNGPGYMFGLPEFTLPDTST